MIQINLLEKDPRISEFTFTNGVMFWQIIRFQVIEMLTLSGEFAPPPKRKSAKKTLMEIIKYIAQIILKTPLILRLRNKKYKYGFIVSDNELIYKDGKYKHPSYEFIANTIGENNSLFIGNILRSASKTPRSFNNYCYINLFSYLLKFCEIISFGKGKIPGKIYDFIEFLKYYLGTKLSDNQYSSLLIQLSMFEVKLKVEDLFYKKLFKVFRIEVLFIGNACYGYNSNIVKLANENKITTVEIQHAIIYRDHPSYNYGDQAFLSPAFRSHFPKYFLIYGDYWRSNIRIPSEVITFGKPEYSEITNLYLKDNYVNELTDILFISQWTITGQIIELAVNTRNILKNSKIYIRPHPREIDSFESLYGEKLRNNDILIDNEKNLYNSLRSKYAVIGQYSSVLYESLGIVPLILVYVGMTANHMIDDDDFKKAHSAKEIAEIISGKKVKYIKSINRYFNNNLKENLERFLICIHEPH